MCLLVRGVCASAVVGGGGSKGLRRVRLGKTIEKRREKNQGNIR